MQTVNTKQRTLHLKGRALRLTRDPDSSDTKGTKVAKVLLRDPGNFTNTQPYGSRGKGGHTHSGL